MAEEVDIKNKRKIPHILLVLPICLLILLLDSYGFTVHSPLLADRVESVVEPELSQQVNQPTSVIKGLLPINKITFYSSYNHISSFIAKHSYLKKGEAPMQSPAIPRKKNIVYCVLLI